MRKLLLFFFSTFTVIISFAQKKPLDHSVYDGWQNIGERAISNDGKWVVYTVNPQEGDNELVVTSGDGQYKKSVPRGYGAVITEDSRFVVFKIKPFFKETREARIKKKKPDEMPKDSLGIIEFGKDSLWKTARVKTFKTPEKEAGWLVYHLEKAPEKKETERKKADSGDKKITDSLNRIIDSLQQVIERMPKKKSKNQDGEIITGSTDAEGDEPSAGTMDAGTDLVVKNLNDGREKIIFKCFGICT